MNWNRSKGFTLLELMIVVAIVGIIAAIAYPSYLDQVRSGRRADAISTLLSLQLAQERYRAMNVSYIANITDANFNLTVDPTNPAQRVSTNGQYRITIGGVTAGAYNFTATPLGDQANDTCGTYQLNQNGPRIGIGGQATSCWSR